jgi:subtilisin family serine protease
MRGTTLKLEGRDRRCCEWKRSVVNVNGGRMSLATRSRSRVVGAWVAVGLIMGAVPVGAKPVGADVRVIVQAEPGRVADVADRVVDLGGSVEMDLPIIDGFSATIGSEVLDLLGATGGVRHVTPDTRIELASTVGSPSGVPMSVLTGRVLDVDSLWRRGITGEGVGIALIDSGVTPVGGLDADGKVLNGPDLSFDGEFDSLRHLDAYGHGTHLAGIIAGSDPGLPARPNDRWLRSNFAGVAPGAHIVNVKVADATGTADVSQVIAGIQWVIDHKNDGPADIRVLTLAFGTDSVQDYRIDPLAHAAESAWHAGIVVVVAAGNDGQRSALRDPANDPFVIAVGATDPRGTARLSDDRVLGFSNCGSEDRSVDLLAPGRSVSSLRVAGSFIDDQFPDAADGDRFFRGTGTSQAAAVVTGAVALMLDNRPGMTPDQVKAALLRTAGDVRSARGHCADAGALDVQRAVAARPRAVAQDWERSDGSGSIEASRGSYHVYRDGQPLTGEVDVTGGTWSGGTWSGGTWSGGTWSGGTWSGGTWSGGTWSGGTWSGGTWSGGTWSGGTWSGGTWSGGTWSGGTWSGGTWSGGTWSGGTWSVAGWS